MGGTTDGRNVTRGRFDGWLGEPADVPAWSSDRVRGFRPCGREWGRLRFTWPRVWNGADIFLCGYSWTILLLRGSEGGKGRRWNDGISA